MTSNTNHPAAEALIQARKTRQPADAQAVQAYLQTPEAAYAVQAAVGAQLGWFGNEPPLFWKSGGPGRDAVLTHAPLPPDGVWDSPAVAGDWPFHIRGLEAEVALRLGSPVDQALAASLTPESARALVDAMTVSIEIVDTRWQQGLDAPALCKLADLQSHGALVLGEWVAYEPRDWTAQTCEVQVGQQPVRTFTGTHSLNDPAYLLPTWLRHATRDGAVLPAGTVVTTGTWCGILHAQAGDVVIARFAGIGEARVLL